jgi:hypothetical protein
MILSSKEIKHLLKDVYLVMLCIGSMYSLRFPVPIGKMHAIPVHAYLNYIKLIPQSGNVDNTTAEPMNSISRQSNQSAWGARSFDYSAEIRTLQQDIT